LFLGADYPEEDAFDFDCFSPMDKSIETLLHPRMNFCFQPAGDPADLQLVGSWKQMIIRRILVWIT
jgi:hypothetical protein